VPYIPALTSVWISPCNSTRLACKTSLLLYITLIYLFGLVASILCIYIPAALVLHFSFSRCMDWPVLHCCIWPASTGPRNTSLLYYTGSIDLMVYCYIWLDYSFCYTSQHWPCVLDELVVCTNWLHWPASSSVSSQRSDSMDPTASDMSEHGFYVKDDWRVCSSVSSPIIVHSFGDGVVQEAWWVHLLYCHPVGQ